MNTNFILKERNGRPIVILKGPWTADVARLMAANQVTDLALSVYAGWSDNNIDFLRELPFLERLDLIAGTAIRDVSPLYDLASLRCLSLNGVRRKLDFSKLPRLAELSLGQWKMELFSSVFECHRLKSFGVEGYSEPDLRRIGQIRSLEDLGIGFSPVESLSGIQGLSSLKKLTLARTNRLETLEGLEDCKELVVLWIEGAKHLKRIDAVASLLALRTLALAECPALESIRPIAGLQALETVGLIPATRIRDGDLSPLLTLPLLKHADFVDRRHYSHRNADFPKCYRLPKRP